MREKEREKERERERQRERERMREMINDSSLVGGFMILWGYLREEVIFKFSLAGTIKHFYSHN